MKLSAFTLVELLVVLGIVGVLFGTGLYGMSQFRSSMEADQGTNQVLSILRAEQNKAKNNVVVESDLLSKIAITDYSNYVFGIRFHFDGIGGMFKSICWRAIGDLNWVLNANCTASPQSVMVNGPGVTFSTSVGGGTACEDVVFENLSEKIIIVNPSGVANCKVGIETPSYKSPNPYKYLNFYSVGYFDATAP